MNTSNVKIGYARTSTADQKLDPQFETLESAGCDMIRAEQKSGASFKDRRELNTILEFVQEGETLVVTRIDRLARSVRDLQIIVDRLRDKGAQLLATEQPVDTSTTTDTLAITVLEAPAAVPASFIAFPAPNDTAAKVPLAAAFFSDPVS